uniref:Ig-like domain-containing protein n=1 Tax=Knipowitschia caucasica TaxID=637954 RepID=A0AAV2L948_KNICA
MNVTGNLTNQDCTTMFYNLSQEHQDQYFFRVQISNFKATAVCDALQINVTDSPWSPIITVSGAQTETQVVTVTCSAVTPCPSAPPRLTWNLHQDSASVTESSPNGTFTTKITHNITLTHAHDRSTIKCNALYPVTGGDKMADSNITLSVFYGPKNTSVVVSPPGPLSAGQSVTLSCSSRAQPPVQRFTWFRRSSSSGSSGSQTPVNVSAGHTYSFNFTAQGDYYCVAFNALGNKSSPVISLTLREDLIDLNVPWEIILGAAVGILVALCIGLFVWCVKVKCKRPEDTQQDTIEQEVDDTAQNEEGKEASNVKPDNETTEQTVRGSQAPPTNTSIHYAEINFSKLRRKEVPNTHKQEPVYANIQDPKAEDISVEDGYECLYAKVKKSAQALTADCVV